MIDPRQRSVNEIRAELERQARQALDDARETDNHWGTTRQDGRHATTSVCLECLVGVRPKARSVELWECQHCRGLFCRRHHTGGGHHCQPIAE